jgi:hypothetical protein
VAKRADQIQRRKAGAHGDGHQFGPKGFREKIACRTGLRKDAASKETPWSEVQGVVEFTHDPRLIVSKG